MTTSTSPQSGSTPAVPSTPPVFIYEEAGDELAFWPPTTLRLVRRGGARVCVNELSTGAGADNMWTGPDVEAALADPELHSLLQSGVHTFSSLVQGAVELPEGTLRAGTGRIEWKRQPCPGCSAAPPGVQHMQRLLTGTMNNQRQLCAP